VQSIEKEKQQVIKHNDTIQRQERSAKQQKAEFDKAELEKNDLGGQVKGLEEST
jgi:hypothetical protein